MFEISCSDRLSAQECLSHPWISGDLSICPSIVIEDDQTDSPLSRDSPARRSYACLSCAQCGAQCCQNDDHRLKKSSVVEILHDRGIICWWFVELLFANIFLPVRKLFMYLFYQFYSLNLCGLHFTKCFYVNGDLITLVVSVVLSLVCQYLFQFPQTV